jgi:hypothetical protein
MNASGHELPFAVARNQVSNATVKRHSRPKVGNSAIGTPTKREGCWSALCQERKTATNSGIDSYGRALQVLNPEHMRLMGVAEQDC